MLETIERGFEWRQNNYKVIQGERLYVRSCTVCVAHACKLASSSLGAMGRNEQKILGRWLERFSQVQCEMYCTYKQITSCKIFVLTPFHLLHCSILQQAHTKRRIWTPLLCVFPRYGYLPAHTPITPPTTLFYFFSGDSYVLNCQANDTNTINSCP